MTWLEYFYLLKEYKEENNGKFPNTHERYKGKNLGAWVSRQRTIYNNGKKVANGDIIYTTKSYNIILSKRQIELLNSIDFFWNVRKKDAWNRNFNLLKEYIEKNKTFPAKNTIYKNVNLGNWIHYNRDIYNNGVTDEQGNKYHLTFVLTVDQIELLNSINFYWTFEDQQKDMKQIERKEDWKQKYELLKEYLNRNNNEYPKKDEYYKGVNLYEWIIKQCYTRSRGKLIDNKYYKYKNFILTLDEIELLDQINFNWDYNGYFIKQENVWLKRFNLLKKYIENHNGEFPKCTMKYEGFDLGGWVSNQRVTFLNGEEINGVIKHNRAALTKDEIQKLDDINFPWVKNKKRFYLDEISSKIEYEKKKRYLLSELNKLLKVEQNEIESKAQIQQINDSFMKILK